MEDQNEDAQSYNHLYPHSQTPQPQQKQMTPLNLNLNLNLNQHQHAYQPTDYSHFPERNPYYYDYTLPNSVNLATYDYLNAYNEMEVQLHQQHGDSGAHRPAPAVPLNYPPQNHRGVPIHNAIDVNMNTDQPPSEEMDSSAIAAYNAIPIIADAWTAKFNLLLSFKARHGHVDVPQKYKENKPLGKWVGRQRELYKINCKNVTLNLSDRVACALTEERILKLNELGFKWTIGKGQYGKIHGIFDGNEPHNRAWEEKFALLELYKGIFGDLNLPSVSSTGKFETPIPLDEEGEVCEQIKDEDIKTLSRWVKSQKQKYQDVQEGKVAAGLALERRFSRLMEMGIDLTGSRHSNRCSSRNISRAKENRSNLWETRYTELCEYVKKHEHANVPISDKENVHLARWVGAQREFYKAKKKHLEQSQRPTNIHLAKKAGPEPLLQKQNSLTDTRILLLEKIGFEFSMQDNRWDERLRELAEYKAKKGHVRVRHAENKQLYEWINRQRNLFREYMGQGFTSSGNLMTNDRVTRLEKLGFKWKYTFHPLTEKKLQAAVEFAENGGRKKDENIKPSSEARNESSNSNITNFHRDATDEATGKAAARAVASLLNEPTRGPQEANDDNEFAAIHTNNFDGHLHNLDSILPIPVDLNNMNPNSNESNTANAFNRTATQHKRGTKPQLWHQQYEKLVQYQIENGHCRVPGRCPTNPKLGMWVKLQREDYKHLQEGKLSPMNDFRIDLLNKIGFEWSIFGDERKNAWNTKLNELICFREEYGHCDVPQKFAPNKTLGKWVSKQREAHRAYSTWQPSSLTKERLDLLLSVGFRFNIGRGKATRTWESFFNDLVSFEETFGHTNVPVSYPEDPSFGKWVYQQRLNLHRRLAGRSTNGITKMRLDKLEGVGFTFHVKEIDQVRKRRSDFGVSRGKRAKTTQKNICAITNEKEANDDNMNASSGELTAIFDSHLGVISEQLEDAIPLEVEMDVNDFVSID